MPVRIRTITFDATDPGRLAAFWEQVTGFREDPEDPNLPGHTEHALLGRDGSPNLLFIRVPEPRHVKNRVHLDLMPADATAASRDAEIQRITGLGAVLLADHRNPDGSGWAVLADPEGNEFCVERGRRGG
jgi:predicted enzyme related to lactoylglutathione lyase